MTINPQSVEEKAVYAALKDIFRDDRAKVRQLSKIRALVEQHSKKNDLSALIQLHGAESLCKSAQALLADSIFVSEDRAKARFAVLATTPAVPVPAKAATGGAPVLNLFADSHKGFEALGTEKTRVSESDTQISPAPAAKTQAQTMQSPLQSKINNLSATEHDVATTTKTADVEPETTTTSNFLYIDPLNALLTSPSGAQIVNVNVKLAVRGTAPAPSVCSELLGECLF